MKLRELVRNPTENFEIYVRQAGPDTYRQVLKEIKQKEIYNMLIDTKPEHMHHLLRGILQLQMNEYTYHYLFTTFVSTVFVWQ